MKEPCVYILASGRNGTLYIGVTSDLEGRLSVHVQDLVAGFTAKHRVHQLVYYEMHPTMQTAIKREKQLKKWNRLWKIRLIEQANPDGSICSIARAGRSRMCPRTRSGEDFDVR